MRTRLHWSQRYIEATQLHFRREQVQYPAVAAPRGGWMTPPELLPFGGEWTTYEAELHRIFVEEIAGGGLQFNGQRVGCRRHPEAAGRWASFWFDMLRRQPNLNEVNFWAPSAVNFRALRV